MHLHVKMIGTIALALGTLASCGSADNAGLFDVGAKSSSVIDTSKGVPAPAAGGGGAVTPAPGRHLWLTVSEVDVKLDKGGWHNVFTGSRRLDLFDTSGAEVPLGATALPTGTLTELRLVLAGDPELVTAEFTTSVQCPSCSTSGLKLKPQNDLTVHSADHVHASVVFDPRHSLFATPHGYVLHPVVRVTLSRDADAGAP